MERLVALPLLVSLVSASSLHVANIWSVGGRCDLVRESASLHCAASLVAHAAPSHFRLLPPLSNATETCRTWQHYLLCTAGVHPRCRRSVAPNVERLYETLCEESMRERLLEAAGCLEDVETDPVVRECVVSKANALRDEEEGRMLRDDGRVPTVVPDGREDDGAYQCKLMEGILECVSAKPENCTGVAKIYSTIFKSLAAHENVSALCDLEVPTGKKRVKPQQEIPLEECDSEGNCTCRSPGFTFDKETKKCTDVDECGEESAGCSQRCHNEPGSYSCSCEPLFFELGDDKKTCIRRDDQPLYIFFAHGQSLWNISIDGKSFQLQRAGLQKTAMIDVDVQERRLYYADIGAKVIERMNVEGTFPQTIQVEGVEGIAVDWVGRNLYSVRHTNVLVQSLEGRYRSILYKDVLTQPRALALHPLKGLLFATDWGSSAFIASASLDGSSFRRILSDRVVWPNALAVDLYAEKIYWADAFLDVIEYQARIWTVVGGGWLSAMRALFLMCSGWQWLMTPSSGPIGLIEVYRLMDVLRETGLLRANKKNGENITVLAQTALLPYSLKIFHPSLQPPGSFVSYTQCETIGKSGCESSGCSQLCVVSKNGTGHVCRCGEGFQLGDDGKSCHAACPPNTVHCGGKDPKCISKLYYCDGIAQCSDHADEQNCPPRICLPGQFQCHLSSGGTVQCVPPGGLCNKTQDCADNSDEKYCS